MAHEAGSGTTVTAAITVDSRVQPRQGFWFMRFELGAAAPQGEDG
ncbi:MAG: hypothetical protein ACKO3M_11050 [Rubrivivax sp.]